MFNIGRFTKTRAKAGAKLLDILKPGWAAKIDLDKLKLSSCDACVLGQLFGGYSKGAETLFAMRLDEQGITTDRVTATDHIAEEMGFYVTSERAKEVTGEGGSLNALTCYYTPLTDAWKDEIRKRQKVKKVASPNVCPACGETNCSYV